MSQYMYLFTKNKLVDKPVLFNIVVRCSPLYEALENYVTYGDVKVLTPSQISLAIEDAENELRDLKERRKEYKEIKAAAIASCNIDLFSDTAEYLRDIKSDIKAYEDVISKLYFFRSMAEYCEIYAGIEIEDFSFIPDEVE